VGHFFFYFLHFGGEKGKIKDNWAKWQIRQSGKLGKVAN
jgi:hypothetical protein